MKKYISSTTVRGFFFPIVSPLISPPLFPTLSQELPNWQALQDRIRRGEARIARNKQIKEALERKVGRRATNEGGTERLPEKENDRPLTVTRKMYDRPSRLKNFPPLKFHAFSSL